MFDAEVGHCVDDGIVHNVENPVSSCSVMDIDRHDPGMRMRGAHEHDVGRVVEYRIIEIRDEPSLAAKERDVLTPPKGRANESSTNQRSRRVDQLMRR